MTELGGFTKIETPKTTIERIYVVMNELSRPYMERVFTGSTNVLLDREPLLEQLRVGMYGDMGKTESGKSAAAQERSVLDITAFTMYEDITGRIEAYHRHLTGKPKRDLPEDTLRAWYVAFDSNYRAGKYTDGQMLRTLRQLEQFAARIKAHFDPPRVKEIAGACPNDGCGIAEVNAPDGSRQTALYAAYKNGIEPSVKCRACGAERFGERTLLELGYHLGATVDEDTLREMGVIA